MLINHSEVPSRVEGATRARERTQEAILPLRPQRRNRRARPYSILNSEMRKNDHHNNYNYWND